MTTIFRALVAVSCCTFWGCGLFPRTVRVGSKGTTEQIIIGEILAQHLEKKGGLKVVRRLGIGNATVLNQAAIAGDVDIFPEDTATGISVLINEVTVMDPVALWERVRAEYERMYGLRISKPLGASVRTMMVVTRELAQKEKLSDLSSAVNSRVAWKLGITEDFAGRRDGMSMLGTNYKFGQRAAAPMTLEAGALYQTLTDGHVNMIPGTEADALIDDPAFHVLADDKKIFSPADICLMTRIASLTKVPELADVAAQLSGMIGTASLRKMSRAAQVDKRPIADIARDFLAAARLH